MAQRHSAAMAAEAPSGPEAAEEKGVPVLDDAPADSDAWVFLCHIGTSRAHLEVLDAKVAGEPFRT